MMGRSGYSDDYGDEDPLALARWRGQVASAIRGKRGQAFLIELRDALDAMPDKRLIKDELWNGEVCAIGAVCEKRGFDLISLDLRHGVPGSSRMGGADERAKYSICAAANEGT